MFHRRSSKNQKKCLIPPIPKSPCLNDLSNIPIIKAQAYVETVDTLDKISKIKNTSKLLPKQISNKTDQFNNNQCDNINKKNFDRKYSNYQKQNNVLKSIYERRPINYRNKSIYQRKRSINNNSINDNIDHVKNRISIQANKKDQYQHSIQEKQVNEQTPEQKFFYLKNRKTSYHSNIYVYLSTRQEMYKRGKAQSGFIKYQSNQSQKNFSDQYKIQNAVQVYKRAQSQYRKNYYVNQRKSLSKNSESAKILKNQIYNEKQQLSQIQKNNQMKQKKYRKNVKQKPKALQNLNDISEASLKNNITPKASNVNSKNFIIKSKSKNQMRNYKNHNYLDKKNVTANNCNQNQALKGQMLQTKKRSITISPQTLNLMKKQTEYCYPRKKSNDAAPKNNISNDQQKNKNQRQQDRKYVSKTVKQVITNTQLKQKQRILKQIQTTQSIKLIIEQIYQNRKTQEKNIQQQQDISIILDRHKIEKEDKQNCIEKGFSKKKRRFMGGCKLRRVQWGGSKQKDKNSSKILNSEIALNIQDFYTPPLNQNQVKKQIESSSLRQVLKVNTINLFQQIMNDENSLGISKIQHNNDDRPLQSLQQLYRQL